MSQPPKTEKKIARPGRLRDAWLGGWSKLMNRAVESDTMNRFAGAYVDVYLRTLEPFQQAIERSMEKTMHQLQLPTRSEVASLASRMTNIEKKLDDILTLLEERQGKV
jgi:polyhydroxyalkanoate synthesis regulator phasin